jgi:hypothetical protein
VLSFEREEWLKTISRINYELVLLRLASVCEADSISTWLICCIDSMLKICKTPARAYSKVCQDATGTEAREACLDLLYDAVASVYGEEVAKTVLT